MNWRECESLKTLLAQLNTEFPTRSKVSDGTIGDARHQAEKSDHNPNAAGVVTALDVTHDPASGCTGDWLAEALSASKDPRIKYLIWNRRITVKGDITQWKAYHGFSPHTEHVHISVSVDPKLYDSTAEWNLSDGPLITTHPELAKPRDLHIGMSGDDVKALQEILKTDVDGVFGKRTELLVKGFQMAHGLRVDGIVGANTRVALGL